MRGRSLPPVARRIFSSPCVLGPLLTVLQGPDEISKGMPAVRESMSLSRMAIAEAPLVDEVEYQEIC